MLWWNWTAKGLILKERQENFEPGPVDMGCKQELSASIRDREIVW